MQGPAHFIRHYASHHCKCQYDNNNNDDNDISRHLSQDHLQDILNDSIRSTFSRHEHPALDTMRYKYYDPVKDSDHTENQLWKETPFGYDQVHVIEWVIDSCSASKLSHYLPQLVPPMLLIIDDYDVEYKVRGVHILHRMIKKISVDNDPTLRRVDNVFIATLFNCLTYLSNQSHIPLLEASYPCLMDLISKTKASGTKQRAELFEKIMVNGILLGLQYGQSTSNVRQVLFEQLPRIYTEMNVLGVQYLKVILTALTEALAVPNIQFNKTTLNALQIIIQVCWPRIPNYHGIILTGLATSWQSYYEQDKNQEMCHLLKETFKIYRSACKGIENADVDALLEFNHSVYSVLVK